MNKLIIKTVLYLVCLVTAFFTIYVLYSHFLTNNSLDNQALYVWGDSQTYQGLILDNIEHSLNAKCLSSAEHGNGVYDFLVFTEEVPNNSTCIIGMSEALLYRKISSDNNHSGTNLKALYTLFESGYSASEIIKIAQTNNFLPYKNIFTSRHSTYPYADTIFYAEPLDGWKGMFATHDEYHIYKKKAYSKGFQRLLYKGCTVHIVTYPLYSEIESFAKTSPNRKLTLSYQSELIKKHNLKYEEIYIKSDSLIMRDLSHLNEVGARHATNAVINHLQTTKHNSILEIKIVD